MLLPLLSYPQFLTWDYHNIATDTRLSGAYPDMVVDALGTIHVSYWNEYEDRLIYMYRPAGTQNWTREYVDANHPNGYRSAIALDNNNNPHIAYFQNSNTYAQVRYATRSTPGNWSIENIPGDPVYGWGEYGPSGTVNTSLRLKASIDLLMDENQQPQIVFFDGWSELNAFNPCSNNSEYGLRMHQAIRTSNGWVERGFGKIHNFKNSCGDDLSVYPMPEGDRYGEFCQLVQRQDNTMQTFCLSRFNNQLLNFRNNLPNSDTIWQVGRTDSLNRMLNSGWVWTRLFFTIEGIGAKVDASDIVHLSYTSSLIFGENFYAGALGSNEFVYSRIVDDTTVTYHHFGTGMYRTYTDIETQGSDSIYISYANMTTLQFEMQSSFDGGLTWDLDTIATGVPIYTSPTEIHGDSVMVLMFDAGARRLSLGHRHLDGGPWRIEVVNQSQNQGYSLDAFLDPGTTDTTFTTVFTDNYNGRLLHSTSSTSNGYQFATTLIDSTPSGIGPVALDRRSNGENVIAYARGTNHRLQFTHGNPGAWITEQVDSNAVVDFLDMRITPQDTVHIVYYANNDSCLKYAKRHITGSTWQYDNLDCDTITSGQYPSLAVDAAGIPHISYYKSNIRSLKYATLDPQTRNWVIDSLHGGSSSAIGKFSSIRLDQAGLPKIAYLDEQSTALWLIEKDANGLWTKTMVDSVPVTNLGRPIDMEIDAFGKVWIAYNFYNNFDRVKLMHRDSIWREVSVSSSGQISNAFAFRILGGSLNLFGKKNAPQNSGVALLRSGNGVHVWRDKPDVQDHGMQVLQFPNPFDGTCTLQLEVSKPIELSVNIYDAYGRKVCTLSPTQKRNPGLHIIEWDAQEVPAGMYYYVVESRTAKITGKMVLLR